MSNSRVSNVAQEEMLLVIGPVVKTLCEQQDTIDVGDESDDAGSSEGEVPGCSGCGGSVQCVVAFPLPQLHVARRTC